MTVLLLPGNMCDARLWSPLGAELDRRNIAWRVGDLSRQSSITAMAADMLAEQDGPLLPVGFSMGAIVALEMARQAPERLRALGLLALNASADLPERAQHRPRQQTDVRGGALERVVAEELKPNYLAAANRGDAALLALTMDMALALGADVFVRQSEALRTREDLRPVLSTLALPVLLACGAEDALCPPEWHRRWAEAIGPAAVLHQIAGAGHLLPIEQPRRLAAVLIPWLQTIEEPS